jgi:molecular chaperone GrpE
VRSCVVRYTLPESSSFSMTNDQDTSAASTNGTSPEELQKRIQELEKELAEMQRFKDLAARAQADLQNAKGRIERESDELRKFATEKLIVRLLPTLDNFQRAFAQLPADLQSHEWIKGVTAIEQDLMKQMTDAGLKRMQSLGEIADPARHEVLTMGPGKEGTVTEVFEEGYELHGKVLRPARVKVGDGNV